MKKRQLGSVLTLLFVSAITATAGTLAWFSTNRTAQINFNQASVGAGGGDLQVKYVSSRSEMTPSVTGVTNDLDLTHEGKVTDISGDGLNFYKPVWSANEGIASEIRTIYEEATTTSANDNFVDFTIEISRPAGSTEGIKVYLDAGTGIFPKTSSDAKDEGIVKATRLAVITYDTSNVASVHTVYAPEEEEVGAQHIVKASPTDSAYGINGFDLVSSTVKHDPFVNYSTQAAADAGVYPSVANLMTDFAANVTFRVWVEGTDTHANNAFLEGKFIVNINLYALAS